MRVSSAYVLILFLHTRYDVELYQRIEQLIGKKLPLHATVEEEVMSLMERVSEAQRYAKMVRKPNFQDIIVRRTYHNIFPTFYTSPGTQALPDSGERDKRYSFNAPNFAHDIV